MWCNILRFERVERKKFSTLFNNHLLRVRNEEEEAQEGTKFSGMRKWDTQQGNTHDEEEEDAEANSYFSQSNTNEDNGEVKIGITLVCVERCKAGEHENDFNLQVFKNDSNRYNETTHIQWSCCRCFLMAWILNISTWKFESMKGKHNKILNKYLTKHLCYDTLIVLLLHHHIILLEVNVCLTVFYLPFSVVHHPLLALIPCIRTEHFWWSNIPSIENSFDSSKEIILREKRNWGRKTIEWFSYWDLRLADVSSNNNSRTKRIEKQNKN